VVKTGCDVFAVLFLVGVLLELRVDYHTSVELSYVVWIPSTRLLLKTKVSVSNKHSQTLELLLVLEGITYCELTQCRPTRPMATFQIEGVWVVDEAGQIMFASHCYH